MRALGLPFFALIVTTFLFTLASCGNNADSAKKRSEIPAQTAEYEEDEKESIEINLKDYVDFGAQTVTFKATSDDKDAVKPSISKSKLTLSYSSKGSANITVDAYVDGAVVFSFHFPVTVTAKASLAALPDRNKGYFDGEHATFTLDLSEYTKTNGTAVTYSAESSDTGVADVSVEKSLLTATLKCAAGDAKITVKAYSDGTLADTQDFTLHAKNYQKIVCVGDSLTAGHTWPDECYPAALATLLGEDYTVVNCGLNGASLTGTNHNLFLKYKDQPEYATSLAPDADVVVIMMGVNDSKAWFPELVQPTSSAGASVDTFDECFASLLASYEGKTVIVVTQPPPMPDNAFSLYPSILEEEIIPREIALAEEANAVVFDFSSYVAENYPTNQDTLYRDGVHFTQEAAELFAEKLLEVIYKN